MKISDHKLLFLGVSMELCDVQGPAVQTHRLQTWPSSSSGAGSAQLGHSHAPWLKAGWKDLGCHGQK